MSNYANPDILVSTEWLADNLNNPDIRIVESNEDELLYPSGHIPGAVEVDWTSDLNDQVVRDYIGIDDSYLTKVLDKLAEKRIIIKAVSDQDRRARVIKIHPANSELVQGVYNQLQSFNDQILSVNPASTIADICNRKFHYTPRSHS